MRWRKLERREITVLAVGGLASLTLFAFITLAGEVTATPSTVST